MNRLLLWVIFTFSGVLSMEEKDLPRTCNVPIDMDMVDYFLSYVEQLEYFEKQAAIIRLQIWLESQKIHIPQLLRFDN